jgi:hypothetical protein
VVYIATELPPGGCDGGRRFAHLTHCRLAVLLAQGAGFWNIKAASVSNWDMA